MTPQPLTALQAELLEYLLSTVEKHGRQPTFREIGEVLGIASPNGVAGHLKALEKKGHIRRLPKRAGGVVFVGYRFQRVPITEGPCGTS